MEPSSEYSYTSSAQAGSAVGRDQAGRDINNNRTTNHNYYNSPNSSTPLDQALRRLLDEIQSGDRLPACDEIISHYMEKIDDFPGLQAKLEEGNRADLLSIAIVRKDWLAKTLTKCQYHPSGQIIFKQILSDVYGLFRQHIVPLLARAAPLHEIDSAIQQYIVEPVHTSVSACPELFTRDTIEGAVYYLTGNCHIRWHGHTP